MALTGTSLNRILERHNEIEKQAKLLQQQVQSFQRHFNIPSEIDALPPPQPEQKQSQPATSNIPSGNYAVFISTKQKPIPMDVISAYIVATKSLQSSKSDIKLKIIDSERNPVPKINTPAPYKAEIFGNVNVTRLLYRIANKES
eukprot:209945_1